ncbi:MAG: PAS domain S-box protein [Bacteroidota bacterium]
MKNHGTKEKVSQLRSKQSDSTYDTNCIFQSFMESAVDLIFLKDVEGRYIEVSKGLCKFFNLDRSALIGNTSDIIFGKKDLETINKSHSKVVQTLKPDTYEIEFNKEGKKYVFETIKSPIFDKEGNLVGVTGITRDITSKKLAEEALITKQQLLKQSEKQSSSGSFEYDHNSQELFCSRQLLENFGYKQDQRKISFSCFLERINRAEREIFKVEFERAIAGKTEFFMEHRCTRLNSKEIIHCKTYVVPGKKHNSNVYFGVVTDVTRDRQLRKSTIDIQEKERKTIASNLHDSLGQKLVASKMYLSQLDDGTSEALSKAGKLIDQSINEIRSLSKTLSFYTIQGQGLKSAIEDVLSTFPDNIEVKYISEFQEEALTDELSTQIYRIVQEGATNILKYAKASKVELSIKNEKNLLSLFISDNGIGFDTSNEQSGNGLRNIRERVARCNGFIEIISNSKGTSLKIKLPIQ